MNRNFCDPWKIVVKGKNGLTIFTYSRRSDADAVASATGLRVLPNYWL